MDLQPSAGLAGARQKFADAMAKRQVSLDSLYKKELDRQHEERSPSFGKFISSAIPGAISGFMMGGPPGAIAGGLGGGLMSLAQPQTSSRLMTGLIPAAMMYGSNRGMFDSTAPGIQPTMQSERIPPPPPMSPYGLIQPGQMGMPFPGF